MIIKAIVKLQTLPGTGSLTFVAKDGKGWGTGEKVNLFEVTAESWDGVHRVLRLFDVVGAHRCNKKTAISFTKDIGTAMGRLRLLEHQPLSKERLEKRMEVIH